ncbi:MAG: adenine phosphoribosyltransferase [Endomicrobium sp.]|nr:adenine phosphoribosyltransferase [Endomicrobium sp.]
MSLELKIKNTIRDVINFPSKGIVFKDITPVFKNIFLFNEIIDVFVAKYKNIKIDKIAGIESRGFVFGMPLAVKMNIPFILIRKRGKLPAETVEANYSLEYGATTIEMHKDAVSKSENVLIVDDLLATGGTVNAAIELIEILKGNVIAAVFVSELLFLKGREKIKNKKIEIFSIVKY